MHTVLRISIGLLELKLDDANFHAARGNALAMTGQFESAIAAYYAASEKAPNLRWVYANRARCYLQLKRIAPAIDDCSEAIRRDKMNFDAWLVRGQAHLANGELAAATEDLNRCLKIDPMHAEAHYNRSLVHAALEHAEQAAADRAKAVRFEPRLADAPPEFEVTPITLP